MKSYREPFPKVSGGSGTRKVLLILFTKQFELPARRSTSRIISPASVVRVSRKRVFIKPFRDAGTWFVPRKKD